MGESVTLYEISLSLDLMKPSSKPSLVIEFFIRAVRESPVDPIIDSSDEPFSVVVGGV